MVKHLSFLVFPAVLWEWGGLTYKHKSFSVFFWSDLVSSFSLGGVFLCNIISMSSCFLNGVGKLI